MTRTKPGRNDLCHCGSGKKYKKCCEAKESGRNSGRLWMILIAAAVAAGLAAGIASFNSESAGMRVWDPEHGHYHDASGTAVP